MSNDLYSIHVMYIEPKYIMYRILCNTFYIILITVITHIILKYIGKMCVCVCARARVYVYIT